MKSINNIKKATILFSFMMSLSTLFAQNDTMYIMKNGAVVGFYNVNTEVDSIIFYKPDNFVTGLKVQTNYPENRTDTTIVVSGTILSYKADDIVEKGFVYGTDYDPTLGDSKIVSDSVSEGNFYATISISETDFFVRAYAINATDTAYGFSVHTGPVAMKPNIYMYPTEKMQLSVNISFPLGGSMLTSIPKYNSGWNISVEPSGKIDNEYTYLFYESSQPSVWQTKAGWQVPKTELTQFFTTNMTSYSFNTQEITDFIDYWIPRLVDNEYYTIYPQTKSTIDSAIQLEFSEQPENILRLLYVIKGQNQLQDTIEEPTIEGFTRKGYTVTEWGVILK